MEAKCSREAEIGWPRIYDGCKKYKEKKASSPVGCSKCKWKFTVNMIKVCKKKYSTAFVISKHIKGRKNTSADML